MSALSAIANSETRTEVERLAEEQTGLRRVATLVARKAPSREVFAAVGEEIERLLHVENTTILRYGRDKTATPKPTVPLDGKGGVPRPVLRPMPLADEWWQTVNLGKVAGAGIAPVFQRLCVAGTSWTFVRGRKSARLNHASSNAQAQVEAPPIGAANQGAPR